MKLWLKSLKLSCDFSWWMWWLMVLGVMVSFLVVLLMLCSCVMVLKVCRYWMGGMWGGVIV